MLFSYYFGKKRFIYFEFTNLTVVGKGGLGILNWQLTPTFRCQSSLSQQCRNITKFPECQILSFRFLKFDTYLVIFYIYGNLFTIDSYEAMIFYSYSDFTELLRALF